MGELQRFEIERWRHLNCEWIFMCKYINTVTIMDHKEYRVSLILCMRCLHSMYALPPPWCSPLAASPIPHRVQALPTRLSFTSRSCSKVPARLLRRDWFLRVRITATIIGEDWSPCACVYTYIHTCMHTWMHTCILTDSLELLLELLLSVSTAWSAL